MIVISGFHSAIVEGFSSCSPSVLSFSFSNLVWFRSLKSILSNDKVSLVLIYRLNSGNFGIFDADEFNSNLKSFVKSALKTFRIIPKSPRSSRIFRLNFCVGKTVNVNSRKFWEYFQQIRWWIWNILILILWVLLTVVI